MTSRLPHEIDAAPYLDSVSLLESHYRAEGRQMNWEARLAGARTTR